MQALNLIRIYRGRPRSFATGQYIATIERATLTRFSTKASTFLGSRQHVVDFGIVTEAPDTAIIHVLDWMKAQANCDPAAALPMRDSIEDAMWSLQVCHALSIKPDLRGRLLRDGIKTHVQSEPLTLQQLTLLFEHLRMEKELKTIAVQPIVITSKTEGTAKIPDYEKIKDYCERKGIVLEPGEGSQRKLGADALNTATDAAETASATHPTALKTHEELRPWYDHQGKPGFPQQVPALGMRLYDLQLRIKWREAVANAEARGMKAPD